jgi:maltose-binding protein MalE
MKISLFQGILFGVFGIGALVGLFVFATYTSNNGGSDTVGTVVIWGTLPSAGMQATLTAAAQTDTELKNVSYVRKNAATLPAELASAIATGVAPDLILASQEELHALAKFISPIPQGMLSARTFTDTFVAGGTVFTAPGGAGYYGLPFLVDPLVLFSNRSILATSGIARPPATWEALTGLVPNVAILTPSRQITRGLIALGTYDNVHDARGILSALLLQQGVPLSWYSASGNLTANLGVSMTSGTPPGPAVLGFYTQFTDPSKVSYTWNASLPDSLQAFLAGDLALYLGYVSEARYLRSANPNLDFDVTPLPQPATATLKSAYGLVYALMIPRGAPNAAGAYQAAALLTNSIEQAAAAANTGLAPATLNQLVTAPADPISAVAYAEALYTRGWLSPMPADTDTVFSSMISNVISGRSNLEAALVSAERSLSSLLQQ